MYWLRPSLGVLWGTNIRSLIIFARIARFIRYKSVMTGSVVMKTSHFGGLWTNRMEMTKSNWSVSVPPPGIKNAGAPHTAPILVNGWTDASFGCFPLQENPNFNSSAQPSAVMLGIERVTIFLNIYKWFIADKIVN